MLSPLNEKRQDRPHAIFTDIEVGAKSSYSEIIVGPPLNHYKKYIIQRYLIITALLIYKKYTVNTYIAVKYNPS
jgi:hypothetical protein